MKDLKSFIKFAAPVLIYIVVAAIVAWILSLIIEMTPADIIILAMALLAGFMVMDIYVKSAKNTI